MFHTKYIGVIPKEVLQKQRVELEPNISGMFKVFIRSLTTNMSEDEIYTDQSTVASVMLLGKILDDLYITNAVKLSVNGNVVFEDLHDNDHDLPQMIDAIEKAEITKLESAEITMENHIDDMHVIYMFSVLKNEDGSAKIILDMTATVEEQGGSDSQAFYDDVDVLVTKLENANIEFIA